MHLKRNRLRKINIDRAIYSLPLSAKTLHTISTALIPLFPVPSYPPPSLVYSLSLPVPTTTTLSSISSLLNETFQRAPLKYEAASFKEKYLGSPHFPHRSSSFRCFPHLHDEYRTHRYSFLTLEEQY